MSPLKTKTIKITFMCITFLALLIAYLVVICKWILYSKIMVLLPKQLKDALQS